MPTVANGMFGEGVVVDLEYAPTARATLAGGGVVVLSLIAGSLTATILDASGQQVGTPKILSSATRIADVVALANGGFAAVWDQTINGTRHIQARTFDAAGNSMSSAFTVAHSASNFENVDGATVVESNGTLVFTWGTGDTVTNRSILSRVFDESGVALSAATSITPYVPNTYNYHYETTALADGRVAIPYSPVTDNSRTYGALTIAIYDPFDGSVARDFITVGQSPGYRFIRPELTLLSTGNLLVSWTEYAYVNGANSYVLRSQMYDSAGNSLGAGFSVALPNGALGNAADVVALSSGGFALAYEFGAAEAWNLLVQVFDASGAMVGPAFQVNAPGESRPHMASLTTFGSGELLVTWDYQISSTVSDSSSRIYYSTTNGTAATDLIEGTASSDYILGLAGSDTINGYAGIDYLEGGDGDDMLIGGAGADRLTGGAGADTFSDSASNFNGDTIVDMGTLDRIVIRDADLATFTYSLSGRTLSYTGGTLTFGTTPQGLIASAAAGGGVQLVIGTPPFDAASDFNGDRRSDFIAMGANGGFTSFTSQGNGTFAASNGAGANPLDASWRIVGIGDFNGDGKDDLLWRHSSGEIGQWQGRADGTFANTSNIAANPVDNSWSVVGTADYNGDGRDDILWRHTSGAMTEWLARADGSFSNNSAAAANQVDNSWTVVASGDFNGDGRADILWRHTSFAYVEWQGTSTGGFVNIGSVMSGAAGNVVGSGDFNGDGREDVITRTDSGTIAVWLAQATGRFSTTTPALQIQDTSWKIVGIADYDGDGRDDLFWRHSSGAGALWTGTGNGGFAHGGAMPTVDSSWTIQSPDIFLF